METYCTNGDLLLDSGESLRDFLKSGLSEAEKDTVLDNIRERAYREINDSHLRDKTATPANLLDIPQLKQIEIDLVIANILMGAFTAGTIKTKTADFYKNRAEENLRTLQYPATTTVVISGSNNIGNGTISAVITNDHTTLSEKWTLIALSKKWFAVIGTKTKDLPNCEVGIDYPDITRQVSGYSDYGFGKDSMIPFGDFPISFKITEGSIPFEKNDVFTFYTFSASRKRVGRTKIVLA